jgi:hypothetical protein
MNIRNEFYVGVDWGAEKHAVCLTNFEGKILGERFFEHSGEGLAEMCSWLFDKSGAQNASAFVVGIEVPRGPIVSTLLERGMKVHSINPKQSDRFRDRIAASGAKDDKRDARVLASAVRTDLQCFRVLQLDHPLIIEIREWTRIAEDLKDDRVRYSNQLRDQLLRHHLRDYQRSTRIYIERAIPSIHCRFEERLPDENASIVDEQINIARLFRSGGGCTCCVG